MVVVWPLGRRPLDRKSKKNRSKITPKSMTKLVQHDVQNHQKSVENGTKIDQNPIKMEFGAPRSRLLELWAIFWWLRGGRSAPWRSWVAPPHPPGNSKVDFWSKIVSQRADLGSPLCRQRAPESNFFSKNLNTHLKKNVPGRVPEKAWQKWWNKYAKNDETKSKKPSKMMTLTSDL